VIPGSAKTINEESKEKNLLNDEQHKTVNGIHANLNQSQNLLGGV